MVAHSAFRQWRVGCTLIGRSSELRSAREWGPGNLVGGRPALNSGGRSGRLHNGMVSIGVNQPECFSRTVVKSRSEALEGEARDGARASKITEP